MSVGRICSRNVFLAELRESAQAAAERMQLENVGTLIVLDAARKPIGILTDRDLALRVVAAGLDPRTIRVEQVMSAHPRSVSEGTAIEDAVETMRGLAVRRLPVVDAQQRLVGVVSIDDVLELVAEELGILGKITAWVRPGNALPVAVPAPRKRVAAAQGLQRAASDPEC
jgi:CBS domain-containing protein